MKGNGKSIAYSYIRFSTPEQRLGDSERRQIEGARKYALENNLFLDESLDLADRGLSGYKGHHRKGKFGAFLELVKSGKIPGGSTLIVENIDRLSREDIITQMETLIFELIGKGIIIVTLSPQDKFTRESLSGDKSIGSIFRLIAYMQMGHAESAKKAARLSEVWQNKRRLAKDGKLVLTKKAPAWLETKENKFVAIPEAAETIRWIFRLKLDGFNKHGIERKLNESAAWTPKKQRSRQQTAGWRASYIEKILRSRAVLGEFQPYHVKNGQRVPQGDPIPGYFPQIIKPEIFNAVQKRYKDNAKLNGGNGGGKTGKLNNVLRHLVVCGYCGGSMAFVDKGNPPKGGRYLVCDAARRRAKECVRHFAQYAEVEQAVLDNCSKLRPEHVLPNSGEQAEEAKSLRTRIEGLTEEHSRIEQRQKNIAASWGEINDPAFRSSVEKQFSDLGTTRMEIIEKLSREQSALDQLERGRDSFDEWQKSIAGLKGAIRKDPGTRLRLNAHLKQFIGKIEVFIQGNEDDVDRAEDFISEDQELVRSPSVKSFRRFVSGRLLSEDGRCFRIHFKMSQSRRENLAKTLGNRPDTGMQVAPAGSLAYRVEARGKELSFSGPEVGQLFREFFDGRKPGFVPKPNALKPGARLRTWKDRKGKEASSAAA